MDQQLLLPRRASANTTLDRDIDLRRAEPKPHHFLGGMGWASLEGSYVIDQLAVSVLGGSNGGSMARKEVLEKRLLQIFSVTT